MAWYEQLDLDFGSITDQFTDLIGEASTLLENANNLDILNLDAMAVQEELAEALEEEDGLEYEDENEVVYHDQEVVDDDPQPEVVHHYEETTEQDEQHHSRSHYSTPDRHPSHTQPHEHISVSIPSTATKHLHFEDTEHSYAEEHAQKEERTHEEENLTAGLDDSFSWETMDNKTPKKSTKLLSQIRNFNNAGAGSGGDKVSSVSRDGVDSGVDVTSGGIDGITVSSGAGADDNTVHNTTTTTADSTGTTTDTDTFTIEDTGRHTTSPARNTITTTSTAGITSATKPITKNNNTSGTNGTNTNTTGSTSVPTLVPAKVIGSAAASTTAGGANTAKPKPLPKDTTVGNAAGRKARPLKPKPKVSKEFDFWGVNSTKKTLNFPTPSANSASGVGGVSSSDSTGGSAGGSAGGATSGSTKNTDGSAASTHSTEHFYSVVGLFGDDYITDTTEPDIESNISATSNTDSSTTATNNTSTAHARLPLGWLSNIIPTTETAASYFDDIEYENEDPILKQVELNKKNPHSGGESNVDKLWSMWESMVGDDTNSDSTVTTSATGIASSTSPASGGNTNSKPKLSIFIPVETPGVGPVWVVAGLNWLKYLTGVTVIVSSGGSTVDSGGSVVYSADTCTVPNSHYPNWNLFTVRLTQPVDYTYKPLLLFTLLLLRLLLIILVSLLLRLLVFVFKLLSMCVVHCVSYLRTTRLGSRVSSGSDRLRSFFSNERVNNVLGGDAPADQSWVQQVQESVQAWRTFGYEQMNSTNAIMLLTAGLFLYSYFRFQRYGTDAGA